MRARDLPPTAARWGGMIAIAGLLGGLLGAGPARTAEGVAAYRIPEVVVAPTRTEVARERSSASVTVIPGEALERAQKRTLSEALYEVPGFNVVQTGGKGAQTSIFARGANSDQTLVLIDGIEMNDPSAPTGAFDFANFAIDQVDRIEVVRGPLATLYGSEAIGAVISITTKRGAGPPHGYAEVEGGDFASFTQRLGVSGGGERYDYNLSFAHLATQNNSFTPARLRSAAIPQAEDDDYQNSSGQLRLGLMPSENVELNLFLRRIHTKLNTDGFGAEDPNSESNGIQTFGRIEALVDLLDGLVANRLGVSITATKRKSTDSPDPGLVEFTDSSDEGRKVKLDWQADLHALPSNTLTLGFEYEREKLTSESFLSGVSFGAPFQIIGLAREDDEIFAGYLQDSVDLFDRLHLTGSVRVDAPQSFAREVTWRAGAAYLVKETGTKLRGSYGTGFKAPSLQQRFIQSVFLIPAFGIVSPFSGNPALEPETSDGWEAGFEQNLLGGALRFGAVYFETDIENLITTNDAFTTNINLGKALTRGVESFIAVAPAEWASLRLDHSFVRAEDAAEGEDLLRRPKQRASLAATIFPLTGASITFDATFVGRRADGDAVLFNRVYTGSYTVANLAAAYEITPHLKMFGRIENMFDRNFEDPDGFQHRGVGAFFGFRAEL